MKRVLGTDHLNQALIYFLGFFLFLEWLKPLEEITDTGNSYVFIIFCAVCFLISFFRIRVALGFFIRLIVMFLLLHLLFFEGVFVQFQWVAPFIQDILVNGKLITASKWLELTDLFRTFLFFILLWIMTYLMHYWLLQSQKILLFFVLTVIYFSALDTFSSYDAAFSIVKVMIIGFIILGVLHLMKLQELEKIKIKMAKAIIVVSIMVLSAVSTAFLLPKAAPQWPDPIPHLKTAVKANSSEVNRATIKKIGYGTSDEQLGGPFIQDQTLVFTAEVKDVHYWRIETKDYYTGKGWEVSRTSPLRLESPDNIQLSQYNLNVPMETLDAKLKVLNGTPHIIYPVELHSIDVSQPVQFHSDPVTEKIFVKYNGNPMTISNYKVYYDYPKFSIKQLKNVMREDSSFIKDMYTQTPKDLPKRVSSLAKDITAGKVSRYDKVKAVEGYFTAKAYVYDTKDVAVPSENEDYVDQFLFETKKGYCDNFSTSMIVLLRTLDIPARWVKGYTQGEYVSTPEPGVRLYEVRNANAHSWVEVYFPGTGWVPFEPTRGFRNPYDFSNDLDTEHIDLETFKNDQQENKTLEEIQAKEQVDNKASSKEIEYESLKKAAVKLIFAVIMVVFLILIFKKYKMKWFSYYLLFKYKWRKDELVFGDAYLDLLKMLELYGVPRDSGQTLREYAQDIDKKLGTTELKLLTYRYEKIIYANENSKECWQQSEELWENLIKRLSS